MAERTHRSFPHQTLGAFAAGPRCGADRWPCVVADGTGDDRAECVRRILAAGLRPPGKSACFMCAARKWSEVLELSRAHPCLADQAIELEHRAADRGLRTVRGLGRNWNWGDRIRAVSPQRLPTSS